MFSVLIQSSVPGCVKSIVTVCESMEDGKNLCEKTISNYVKSVYEKEGIEMFWNNSSDSLVICNSSKMVKCSDDGCEWMTLENWDIDWKESDNDYEIFMKKDTMSEVWEEANFDEWYVVCKIVDVSKSMKVVISEYTYGIKVGDTEELIEEVDEEVDDDEDEDDEEIEGMHLRSGKVLRSSFSDAEKDGDMEGFLEWAKDKIQVVWSYGALCNSEPLEYFDPNPKKESIKEFLERVVKWVDANEYTKSNRDENGHRVEFSVSEYVFHFFNDALGEEYDEYQEESFNADELIEIWRKDVSYYKNNEEVSDSLRANPLGI